MMPRSGHHQPNCWLFAELKRPSVQLTKRTVQLILVACFDQENFSFVEVFWLPVLRHHLKVRDYHRQIQMWVMRICLRHLHHNHHRHSNRSESYALADQHAVVVVEFYYCFLICLICLICDVFDPDLLICFWIWILIWLLIR